MVEGAAPLQVPSGAALVLGEAHGRCACSSWGARPAHAPARSGGPSGCLHHTVFGPPRGDGAGKPGATCPCVTCLPVTAPASHAYLLLPATSACTAAPAWKLLPRSRVCTQWDQVFCTLLYQSQLQFASGRWLKQATVQTMCCRTGEGSCSCAGLGPAPVLKREPCSSCVGGLSHAPPVQGC